MMLTMSKHINDIFTKRCGCHEIWPISHNNSWKHTISSFCIVPAELDMIFLGWLCTLTNTHWTWTIWVSRMKGLDMQPALVIEVGWIWDDILGRALKKTQTESVKSMKIPRSEKSQLEKSQRSTMEKNKEQLWKTQEFFKGWENQPVATWLKSNAEALPFGEMPEAT